MRVMRAVAAARRRVAAVGAAAAATRTAQPADKPVTANRAINTSAMIGSRQIARKAVQQPLPAARCTTRWVKSGRTATKAAASAVRSTMPNVRTAMPRGLRAHMVIARKVTVRLARCHAVIARKVIARAVTGPKATARKAIVLAVIDLRATAHKARAVKVAAMVAETAAVMAGAAPAAARVAAE